MKLKILPSFILLFSSTFIFGQITIRDADLTNGNYNWTKDNVYYLDGYVFLEEGGVLNIEAGTVIKGMADPSNTDVASALIVSRGAQIFAEGTADEPIIFTAEDDDINDPDDLGSDARGEWGGLIILGRATISDDVCAAEIEGVKAGAGDDRVLYGDENCNFKDDDNSGVLRFVSVRHGGSVLEDGDEINGITLGAVGSGTTIEFVEVYANDDDGIEWFGGTVDVKYAAVSFCADDTYDWDDGFRGRGQYWFSLQGEDDGGNGGEHDGAHPDDNTPPSDPTVYNATYIGMGKDNTADPDAEYALLLRDGSAGDYANSIFTDFSFHAIEVEDRDASKGIDSRKRMEDGDLTLKNNLWFGFGSGDQLNGATNANSIIGATSDAEDPDATFLVDHLTANNNQLINPEIKNIDRGNSNLLDPRPTAGGNSYDALANHINNSDDFFTKSAFKGAFCSEGTWLKGWTALSANNHLDNSIPWSDNSDCELLTSVEEIYQWGEDIVVGTIIPNPVHDKAVLNFDLSASKEISFTIYDVLGNVIVASVQNERKAGGEHQIEINANVIEQGSYICVLTADGESFISKLIVN